MQRFGLIGNGRKDLSIQLLRVLQSAGEVMIDRDVVEGRKDPVRVYAEKAEDAA